MGGLWTGRRPEGPCVAGSDGVRAKARAGQGCSPADDAPPSLPPLRVPLAAWVMVEGSSPALLPARLSSTRRLPSGGAPALASRHSCLGSERAQERVADPPNCLGTVFLPPQTRVSLLSRAGPSGGSLRALSLTVADVDQEGRLMRASQGISGQGAGWPSAITATFRTRVISRGRRPVFYEGESSRALTRPFFPPSL